MSIQPSPLLTCSFLLLTTCVPAIAAWNGSQCCDHCGCESTCKKVCRWVCEMKETSKVTYGCKCEDFCVPGPSHRHKSACSCGHCDSCLAPVWQPVCAEVKTRKVLEKKVEKIMKPSYKWVVEYLCPNCCE